MASPLAAFELPTGRRSYIAPPLPVVDTSDPNWIPVLNQEDLDKVAHYSEKELSPYHAANFSPLPTISNSPKVEQDKEERPSTLKHTYSKSSLAPEHVASELEAEPLPPRTSSKKAPGTGSPLPQHMRDESLAEGSDGQETLTSESGADSSTAPSTSGTTSMIEDQYYTLPGMEIKKEDIVPISVPVSSRSSLNSVSTAKTIMAPTSKYNRKTLTNGRPPTIKSAPTTPHESPRLPPAIPVNNIPIPPVEALGSPPLEDGPPKIHPAKSTASERRKRALHSHPSNQSIQTSRPGSRAENESRPNSRPPSIRHNSHKSFESRPMTPRGTIYDSQTPTPAPTTPLPQLPPEAFTRKPVPQQHQQQQPSSSQNGLGIVQLQEPPPAHIASTASLVSLKNSDHTEMASFMTNTNTVIFRRFDEVHVKLLLCLQDEISMLEKQLNRLESGAGSGDKVMQKLQIMRELRRVVAEYGT